MRVLALLFVLLGLPALAVDRSSWPDGGRQVELAQAKPQGQGQGPGQGQGGGGSGSRGSLSGGDYPGRYCCQHCRHNEIPCGGECIPKMQNNKAALCTKPAGCACPGKP
jgi:hypothetical protein